MLWKFYPEDQIDAGMRFVANRWVGRADPPAFPPEELGFGTRFWKFWSEHLEKDHQMTSLLITAPFKAHETKRFVWAMHLLGMIVFLDDTREDKTEARLQELAERLKHIEKDSHFELLGVHWSANDAQIQAAYERLKEEHHRRVTGAANEVEVGLLQKLWTYHENAFHAVKNRSDRHKYRLKTLDPTFLETGAELLRQKGESYLLTKELYDRAVEELVASTEIVDPDGETLVVLGLARFLHGQQEHDRDIRESGRETLLRGYAADPNSELTNICRGMLHRHDGQPNRAKEYLAKALQINPDSRFAKVEMRAAESGKTDRDRDKVIAEFLEQRHKPGRPKNASADS
ncbi:MAG: hypothetical protein M5R36_04920 [Deltaproteobacteria bacterium]|nr:hypothetical protein [Deltaproteobacteria bacterium]